MSGRAGYVDRDGCGCGGLGGDGAGADGGGVGVANGGSLLDWWC